MVRNNEKASNNVTTGGNSIERFKYVDDLMVMPSVGRWRRCKIGRDVDTEKEKRRKGKEWDAHYYRVILNACILLSLHSAILVPIPLQS